MKFLLSFLFAFAAAAQPFTVADPAFVAQTTYKAASGATLPTIVNSWNSAVATLNITNSSYSGSGNYLLVGVTTYKFTGIFTNNGVAINGTPIPQLIRTNGNNPKNLIWLYGLASPPSSGSITSNFAGANSSIGMGVVLLNGVTTVGALMAATNVAAIGITNTLSPTLTTDLLIDLFLTQSASFTNNPAQNTIFTNSTIASDYFGMSSIQGSASSTTMWWTNNSSASDMWLGVVLHSQ